MEHTRPRIGWILLAVGALALAFGIGSRFGSARAERWGGYGAPQGYYQQPQAPMPPQGYYQQPQAPMPPQGYYQQPMGPGMHHGGWGQHGPRFLFGPLMFIGGLLKLLFFGLLLVGLLKLLGIWRGPRGPWGRCREHPDRQPDPAADQPAAGAPQARPGNEPPFTGATTSL